MTIPPIKPWRYTRRADAIIYHVQTKAGVHISNALRHDIYSNVYHAVIEEDDRARGGEQYWREEYAELKAKGYPLKWNELRLKLARMNTEAADEVLELMRLLDEGESIR